MTIVLRRATFLFPIEETDLRSLVNQIGKRISFGDGKYGVISY